MIPDRILVALVAAFVCFVFAEMIANFPRLMVALLMLTTLGLLLLALYWWFQQCKQQTSSPSSKAHTRPTSPES